MAAVVPTTTPYATNPYMGYGDPMATAIPPVGYGVDGGLPARASAAKAVPVENQPASGSIPQAAGSRFETAPAVTGHPSGVAGSNVDLYL